MTATRSSSIPRALDSAALVTGATSGIGRTTAVRLAARGHRVVVADRDGGRVTEIVEGPRIRRLHPHPASQAPAGRVTALEEIAAAHLAVRARTSPHQHHHLQQREELSWTSPQSASSPTTSNASRPSGSS